MARSVPGDAVRPPRCAAGSLSFERGEVCLAGGRCWSLVLGRFMVRKMIADKDTAAGTVAKKAARWLAEKVYAEAEGRFGLLF